VNYIQSKKATNDRPSTTGNWEAEFHFKLLPKTTIPEQKPGEEEKNDPKAEVAKRREMEAAHLLKL